MTLLTTILKLLFQILVPVALDRLIDYLKDGKELNDWKNSEWAKIEAAAKAYKEDLKKAGNDEQAQKDAFDKLLIGRG